MMVRSAGRSRTLLDDDGVQAQLHLGPLHDPLLHCVFCDEAEDSHLLLLTDPVGSVLRSGENGVGEAVEVGFLKQTNKKKHGTHHRLKVDLRVPVRVVQDDDVGCGQVDAQTSGPGTQHEDEL